MRLGQERLTITDRQAAIGHDPSLSTGTDNPGRIIYRSTPKVAAGRWCRSRVDQHEEEARTGRDDCLAGVETALHDAEVALHNGDAGPRRAIWSRNEPVSILGALRNAVGQREVEQLFAHLERSFSDCTSYNFEVLAYDVVGDMAYTAGLEHVALSIDGQPRSFTLRSTQTYRREGAEWKVAHRHADGLTD